MQFVEVHPWISVPPIDYHLGVDGLSALLILLTGFLTPLCVLVSWTSITQRVKEFFIFLLALETGMIGVFASLDLVLFFVFWEAMLIPMYFLIGIWGHERRVYAAMKFMLYTMVGSALMLVGILYLYSVTGTFDLPRIVGAFTSSPLLSPSTERWLFLAFFVAFAIKVPLFREPPPSEPCSGKRSTDINRRFRFIARFPSSPAISRMRAEIMRKRSSPPASRKTCTATIL